MTYKEKDAFLRQYREKCIEISGLIREREKWETIAMSTAAGTEPGGGSGSGRVQGAAVNAADIMTEIDNDIAAAAARREEVRRVVDAHPARRQRLMLGLRYINGLSVEDVANEIGKSVKWTRQSLQAAVNALNM